MSVSKPLPALNQQPVRITPSLVIETVLQLIAVFWLIRPAHWMMFKVLKWRPLSQDPRFTKTLLLVACYVLAPLFVIVTFSVYATYVVFMGTVWAFFEYMADVAEKIDQKNGYDPQYLASMAALSNETSGHLA